MCSIFAQHRYYLCSWNYKRYAKKHVSFVKEIATDYGFNVWDWCAVLVSICSVFIALASLLIASKTLKSQKRLNKTHFLSLTKTFSSHCYLK